MHLVAVPCGSYFVDNYVIFYCLVKLCLPYLLMVCLAGNFVCMREC